VDVARSVTRFAGIYVDANAVSPATARTIAADGLTGRPFVGTKLYAAQPRTLDRDKDGVACES
jgi:hypothetical protein